MFFSYCTAKVVKKYELHQQMEGIFLQSRAKLVFLPSRKSKKDLLGHIFRIIVILPYDESRTYNPTCGGLAPLVARAEPHRLYFSEHRPSHGRVRARPLERPRMDFGLQWFSRHRRRHPDARSPLDRQPLLAGR